MLFTPMVYLSYEGEYIEEKIKKDKYYNSCKYFIVEEFCIDYTINYYETYIQVFSVLI